MKGEACLTERKQQYIEHLHTFVAIEMLSHVGLYSHKRCCIAINSWSITGCGTHWSHETNVCHIHITYRMICFCLTVKLHFYWCNTEKNRLLQVVIFIYIWFLTKSLTYLIPAIVNLLAKICKTLWNLHRSYILKVDLNGIYYILYFWKPFLCFKNQF